jgi:hypothetical protein
MSYIEPPKGWYIFGTHVDVIVMLEFSEEVDNDGLPKWERPIWNPGAER